MARLNYVTAALTAAMMLGGGQALGNVCRTDHLTCATTMPVDGYCECRSRGATEDGTVVAVRPPHSRINGTAGGCGANPSAPGCR
ncbi:MAG TPA: hypothetical protein VMB34_08330 [Acetobacteraceae bacterium]|nr:hypothetical protein [Acetobacteraceae bacterium]HUB11949.1 hypothetical protein [Acetobacteraceae bacterium]